MQYLHKNSIRSDVILNGLKIMALKVKGIRIKDTLNYLPMGLAKLPKAFGFEAKNAKGFFPHGFNKSGHETYVGEYPPIEDYCPNSMSAEDRDRLIKWHAEKVAAKEIFDMERDILLYCRSDVEILRKAAMKFRDLFLEISNVDPFSQVHT